MAANRRPSMMDPPIENLLNKVDSKFTLITLAARRGRQINAYFNHLSEGLGTIVPPQVASVSRKPLSIALEEVAESKITYRERDDSLEAHETGPDGGEVLLPNAPALAAEPENPDAPA